MKRAGIALIVLIVLSACGPLQKSFFDKEDESLDAEENKREEEQTDRATDQNASEVDVTSGDVELVEGEEIDPDEEKEIPDIPGNFNEVVDYPMTGEFAGESYEDNQADIEKKLDELPEVTDAFSEEASDVIHYTYSLFAEGFSMPNIPIDQWDKMTVGDPEDDEKDMELKEEYHVAILLDSSGSMANYENDKTRMELAKESIEKFVANLPEQAQVTLQVYGHEGSGSEEDKEMSCHSVETLYSLDQYDKGKFTEALNQFEPAGWTPLAKAIEEVTKDFEDFDGEHSTNIIYVVSDGEETCDGDPVKTVEDLADSNIDPIINLIGYQANDEGIKQLKEMAIAAEGNFINATNQEQLNQEFGNTQNMSEIWSDWHGEKQEDMKELRAELQEQIENWHEDMKEKKERQKENLSAALEYLKEERGFDFGPDPSLEFRNVDLSIDNGIRTNYLTLDNENRLEFLTNSNDARMKYLEGKDE